MFDKNEFKNSFRHWAQMHAHAPVTEARAFCYSLIPTSDIVQYSWLVEQSVSWFEWVQRRSEWSPEELSEEDELKAMPAHPLVC